MKNILFIISLFFFIPSSNAEDKDNQLKAIIEKEVALSTSLLTKNKYSDKELHQKQLESMAELTKIYQKIEHDNFIKTGKKVFPKTEKLAGEIDNSGKIYIKKHSVDLQYLKVLHLLANNQYYYLHKSQMAIYYLKKILSYNVSDSTFLFMVKDTLADLYFNVEQFDKSETLYKEMLNMKESSPNKSKYLYNLAWSYFKNGKTENAIKTLVYIINNYPGENNNYYQLSLENLPQFFVLSKKRKEGVEFFKNLNSGSEKMLLTYAKLLIKRGYYEEGQKALYLVNLAKIDSKESIKDLLQIHTIFYEQKRYKDFLRVTLDLLDHIIPYDEKAEEKLTFLSNISNYLNFSKKSIYKKDYDPSLNFMLETTSFIQYLLQTLIKVDPKNSSQHNFHLGEVFFFQKKYEESLHFYKLAFEETNDISQKEKIVTAMLTSLGKIKANDKNTSFYLYTYSTFIALGVNPELTKKIYPKLLAIYLNGKDFDSARKLLTNFTKSFPNENSQKLSMVTDYMNLLANEDISTFMSVLQEIKEGLFGLTAANVEKIYLTSSDKIFNEAIKLLKSGNKEKAFEKFQRFYGEKKFGFEIRSKSLYNMILINIESLAFLEANNLITSWFKLYDDYKKLPPQSESQTFINFQFAHGYLVDASETSRYMFSKLCDQKDPKSATPYFNQSFLFYHTLFKTDELAGITIKAINCSIPKGTISLLIDSAIENYKTIDTIDSLVKLANLFIKFNVNYIDDIIFSNLQEFYYYISFQGSNKSTLIKEQLISLSRERSKIKDVPSFIKHLNLEDLILNYKKQPDIKLTLPEEVFAENLDKKLNFLSKKSKDIEKLLVKAHPYSNYIGLNALITEYELVFNDLNSFISTNKISKELSSDLNNLANGLKKQIKSFALAKDELLLSNFTKFYPSNIKLNSDIEKFFYFKNFSSPLPVDFGGNL